MAAAIPAAISAVGSIFSGITGKNAAKSAAAAQERVAQQAMAQQQAQFQQTQTNFAPFLQGGTSALNGTGGLLDLVGLHGNPAQQSAYDGLQGSPAFTSLDHVGQDAILQNAAATGGLRGGNTQNGLANFRAQLLSSVIQNQLGNLGGLANIGVGAAGSLGGFGQQNSASISQLLGQQGNAQAGGILGSAWAQQNMINGLQKSITDFGHSPGMGGSGAGGSWW